MKLSFRFFCIAYIVVLLATRIGGSLMVSNINASLWDARVERVDAAVNYAADSFTAFADASYNNKLTEAQLADAVRQIKGTLDSTVSSVEILPVKSVDSQYAKLTENVCASTIHRAGQQPSDGGSVQNECRYVGVLPIRVFGFYGYSEAV